MSVKVVTTEASDSEISLPSLTTHSPVRVGLVDARQVRGGAVDKESQQREHSNGTHHQLKERHSSTFHLQEVDN